MALLADLLASLTPYRRRPRPGDPVSFPPYLDGELQRIDLATSAIVRAVQSAGSLTVPPFDPVADNGKTLKIVAGVMAWA